MKRCQLCGREALVEQPCVDCSCWVCFLAHSLYEQDMANMAKEEYEAWVLAHERNNRAE